MAEPRTRIELSNGESFTTSESLETVERMITVSLAGTGFFRVPAKQGDRIVNAAQITQVRKSPRGGASAL